MFRGLTNIPFSMLPNCRMLLRLVGYDLQEMAPHNTVSNDHRLSGVQSLESRGTDSTLGVATVTPDLAPNLALPWVLRLRYGMVVGEALIILGMSYGLRLQIPLLWTLTPHAVVLGSNILLGRMRVLPLQFPQETLGAAF
jgi:hypothetical protein